MLHVRDSPSLCLILNRNRLPILIVDGNNVESRKERSDNDEEIAATKGPSRADSGRMLYQCILECHHSVEGLPSTKAEASNIRMRNIRIHLSVFSKKTLRIEFERVWVDLLVVENSPVYCAVSAHLKENKI